MSSASILELPELTVCLSTKPPTGRLLMVLGGRRPEAGWLATLAGSLKSEVWAVDSGVDACMAAGVIPSLLIGDCDSASPEARQWAIDGGAAVKLYPRDKDLTDFQLALTHWAEDTAPLRTPVVAGGFGGRLDHLYSGLNTFVSMRGGRARSASKCMADDAEGIYLLYSGDEAEFVFGRRPAAFSLLPMSSVCRGVSILGVRWPLEGVTLERRLPWAISNEVAAGGEARVVVRCGRGILGAYWRWEQ